MKTRTFILLFNVILVIFVFFSCGNDNPNTNSTTDNANLSLVQDLTDLYPQQTSLLYLKYGVLNSAIQYQANFSDSIVKLTKVNDSTLLFTTPNFSEGAKSLKVEINGKQFSVSYNILTLPTITNPEGYVDDYITKTTDEINATINELEASSLTLDPSAKDASLFYINKLKTQIASMSDSELKQLATFICVNNISDFTSLNSTRKKNRTSGLQDYEQVLETNLDYFNHYKGLMDITIIEMSKMDGSILNLPKFTFELIQYLKYFVIALKYKLLSINLPSIPKLIDIAFSKLSGIQPSSVKSSIKYKSGTSEIIKYTNKVEKTFTITGIYRNINGVDANSKESGIIRFLMQIGEMNTSAANTNQNYLKDKSIDIPDGISSVVENLSPTTDVSASYFSVENISNKDVELSTLKKSGNNITISFNTNKLTEQSFSYDLKYTNKGFSSYVLNLNATVAPTEPFSIEKVSGDNQTGVIGKKQSSPIKVLVKDEAGNPFVGAKVNFIANNGGSVSQAQATTGSDGTASVEWVSGNIDAIQTVKVTAFKSDNTTALLGSPLIFTSVNVGPFSIEKISGDNQTGELGTKLSNPIKVRVKDDAGNPFVGAKVNFTANNGGSVSQAQATTGADGTASVEWTLGSIDATQTVNVTAYKSDNTTALQGSPLTFSYCICNLKYGSFTDSRDGHVYKTITIGTQTWMAENLAYLPVGASSTTVGSEVSGNDSKPFYYITDLTKYGVLYNWNASQSAAPTGWHLPTDTEWTILTTFLGGESIAGDKMKSTFGWSYSKPTVTNSSCFSGLPGGMRTYLGKIENQGDYGYWWSATASGSSYVFIRRLGYNDNYINRDFKSHDDGYSIRCVKN